MSPSEIFRFDVSDGGLDVGEHAFPDSYDACSVDSALRNFYQILTSNARFVVQMTHFDKYKQTFVYKT